jgi:acetyltransferase-like isoleucine patch superfamily enzyme
MSKDEAKKLLKATIRSGTIIYEGSQIGAGLITGHNAIVRENNIIGDNVIIGTNSYIGPDNKIGNDVRVHTGCFIESTVLEDGVIIAPHVVFTNDPYPPCKTCVETVGGATVGKNTVIGANVTVLPGIKIGENCLIGAGSVVTKDIPDGMVAVGNPAVVIKRTSELKHEHTIHT